MKWYDVEYAGGKSSSSFVGQTDDDLNQLLNNPNPPKFIRLQNISYRSKLSGRYELYDKWDSKFENEVLINTSSIIAARRLKDDLPANPITGEWNAFSDKVGLSIVIANAYADSLGRDAFDHFRQQVNKLVAEKAKHFLTNGPLLINIQELLPIDEFIVNQYGTTILRKKVEGDLAAEVMQFLNNRFAVSNTSDADEEDD